jgi:hypothetical protein
MGRFLADRLAAEKVCATGPPKRSGESVFRVPTIMDKESPESIDDIMATVGIFVILLGICLYVESRLRAE